MLIYLVAKCMGPPSWCPIEGHQDGGQITKTENMFILQTLQFFNSNIHQNKVTHYLLS